MVRVGKLRSRDFLEPLRELPFRLGKQKFSESIDGVGSCLCHQAAAGGREFTVGDKMPQGRCDHANVVVVMGKKLRDVFRTFLDSASGLSTKGSAIRRRGVLIA